MKINDKLVLSNDYVLQEYDLNLFIKHVIFKEGDIFVVSNIDIQYIYHQEVIVYCTLKYNDSKLKYKVTFDDMLCFRKYNKKNERKLKLEKLNDTKDGKLVVDISEI
jgi:hypothetical protein